MPWIFIKRLKPSAKKRLFQWE